MLFDNPKEKKSAIVTFLIGNGFDIGLGLKTQYRDFLFDYLKRPSKTNIIKKMKDNIQKDITFWGDAELAFAKLPFSTFGSDVSSILSECLQDFSGAFSEYLKNEESRICSPDEKMKYTFGLTLCSYYQALSYYPRRNELKRLMKFNQLKINVINFNYTETIDKLLPLSGAMELPEWGEVNVQFSEVCHVHGALSAGNSLLFGVDNLLQVEDKGLADATKVALVKPSLDRMSGCGLTRTAMRMIDESDTVVIFGLSMGGSDQLWWDYLFDYIRNGDHRLCLMQYVENARGTQLFSEEAQWAQQERERFYTAITPNKIKYFKTDMPDEEIQVSVRGPYLEPDGGETFCDPFHLSWLGRRLLTNRTIDEFNGGGPNKEDDVAEVKWNVGQEQLYQLICENPGINQSLLALKSGVSSRSIMRVLKFLKSVDRIEYRGDMKDGGWFIKNSRDS